MKERGLDPQRLAIEQFAHDGGELEGAWPQAGFSRLASSTLVDGGPPADVVWSARGEERRVAGGLPQTWLQLDVATTVTLQCQRCLQPMSLPLHIGRDFRFVRDEAEAASLDEDSDDDVLAAGRWFDLRALIEDELILALPVVPRHEECPQPLAVPDSVSALDDEIADDAAPNPFAALAALRRPKAND